MLPYEAVFREVEPGVFSKKCTGYGAMCCYASERDGLAHTTFSADVKLGQEMPRTEFKHKIQKAMLRTRHLVPGIACTCSVSKPPPPVQEFKLKYVVPKTLDDALRWSDAVLFVYEDAQSFDEAHNKITEMRWWRASDGRYTHELHVHPNPKSGQSWTFSLSAHHCNTDGQSAWMVLDKIFTFLDDELKERAPPLSSLQWGEEVHRLVAAPELIPSIVKDGVPEDFPSLEDFTMPPPSEDVIPWIYPYATDDEVREDAVVTRKLIFTKEETTRFHAACKAHGRTVTQTATALGSLATAECALRIASNAEGTFFKETISTFQAGTHFLSAMNAANARALMPDSYKNLDTEHSTPLNCLDGFSLSFPLEPFRKMIKVDIGDRSVTRDVNRDIFWDEIVRDVADAWKKEDRSIEAFKLRAAVATMMSADPSVDTSQYQNAAPMFTSFGDMTRLNIMERFRPSAENDTLVIMDLDYATHYFQPGIPYCFFQYDGRFRISCSTGAKHTTKEQLDLYIGSLKEWFDSIIQ